MKNVSIASCATIGLLSCVSSVAMAHSWNNNGWNNNGWSHSQNNLVRFHNNISASTGAFYQHYKEHIPGKEFDKEKGWLPRINASASYMSSKRHYLLKAGVNYIGGNTKYTSYNNGAYHKSHTSNNILGVHAKVGKGFMLSNKLMVTPFATYGHRYWNRQLSYTENYHMNYAGGGLMVDYQATPRLIVSAQGMGGDTFHNRMNPNNSSFTYKLGNKTIVKAKLKADYSLMNNWHVFSTVNYTHFKFGKSGKHYSTSTKYSYEPNSTTNEVSINFGVRYTF